MFIFNTTKPHKTTLVAISTLDPQNINHLACGKTFNKDHTIYIVVRPGASVYKFNRRLLHFFSQQKNPINIDVDGILSFFKDHECLAILYGLFSADALVNHISSYKTIKAEPLQHNYIINKTKYQQELKQVEILVEAQLFAAELMRMPNNVLTTNKFETIIKQQFSKLKNIKVDVLNKRDLIKKHMDLILAVGQASEDDNAPRIINIAYKNKTNAKPFVLIGKGLVFDTGGLDLKPASAMRGMHMDMSGAAIVAASIYALAKLGVSANVNGLLALASNEISPRAYRTNDVIKSYGGHTIEITNTDAEGRLVLADAISYADRDLKATKIMTVATLTGGAVVSFGDVYTPVWATNDDDFTTLATAALTAGEAIWHMPFHFAYSETLESKIADYLNSHERRDAQSIIATEFLRIFAKNIDFIHADIAGTSEYQHYAIPVLVRTLFHFIKQQA